MKFRKLIIPIIIALLLACYFTKPGKEDFMAFIQPTVSSTHIPPVVHFEDKFLYTKITTTTVNIYTPVQMHNKTVMPATREEYIGVFKKFWKINK